MIVKVVPASGHLLYDVLVKCGRVGLRDIRIADARTAYGEIDPGRLAGLRAVPGVERVECQRAT